jgi:hypothetical protein
MKNRMLILSTTILLALAISAFSPMPIAQASIRMVGKSDVRPSAVEPSVASSALPAEPGLPYRIIEDASSLSTASQKRTLSGDNFGKDVFERPFTSQAMVYLPDTDILSASIGSDDSFFYFTIKLAGLSASIEDLGVAGQVGSKKNLGAIYGIELDTDKDGRGDFLFTAMNAGKDWSSTGVMAYSDPNKDVGALTPLRSDPVGKSMSDGYEVTLDSAGLMFSRMDPSSEASIQIAVSKQLLGGVSQFLWGAWSDSGLRNLQGLDYNDQFSAKDAGSPIKSDKTYPVKAVFALDNTCRAPFGFSTKVVLPGMCLVAQPEKHTMTSIRTFPND